MTIFKKFWDWIPWWGFAFLAAGWLFILDPICTGGFVPGYSGDSRFNLYVLEHFYRSLEGVSKSFLDAPFFFPWPATIGFSDAHWFTGFIYAAFRWFGVDSMGALAWWFLLGNILNFVAAYYVFRKFGISSFGAGLGAFLYAFFLPATFQFTHVQLAYRAAVPLAFYFLQSYLVTRDPVRGALAVLCCSLQAALTFYIGILLLLLMVGWVIGWVIWNQREAGGKFTVWTAQLLPVQASSGRKVIASLLVVTAGLILFAGIFPNLVSAHLYHFKRSWGEIREGLPNPQSYFMAFHSALWWPNKGVLPSMPVWWEQNLFPGLLITVAFLASFRGKWAGDNKLVFIARWSLLFILFMTISFFGISLYCLVSKLPGYDAIRSVSRVILVMAFPASLLAGYFIDKIRSSSRYPSTGRFCAMMLALFSVYEAADTLKFRDTRQNWQARIAVMEKQITSAYSEPLKKENILILTRKENSPVQWWELNDELDAMLLSQKLGIRTLNGYSGNFPAGWKRMCTADDILANLDKARRFRAEHGFSQIPIHAEDLVLIGEGHVDVNRLADGLKSMFPPSAVTTWKN